MPYNTVIPAKCEFYEKYINENKLNDELFDPKRKQTFKLLKYLQVYFYFQKSGISYELFYELADFFSSLDHKDYPKRAALNTFKLKFAKLNIHEMIHTKNILENNLINGDCSIDSVVIFNKCNSELATSYSYKGKKGAKITHIVNKNNDPLLVSIDPSTDSDIKIAERMIEKYSELLTEGEVTILADKGYDSGNFREQLTNIGCSSIIPVNVRRTDTSDIKKIKEDEKKKISDKRVRLTEQQKHLHQKQRELKKQKKQVQKEQEKRKKQKKLEKQKQKEQKKQNIKKQINTNKQNKKVSENDISTISIKKLDKLIKDVTTKLDEIKIEKDQLPKILRESIKNEIQKLTKDDKSDCDESHGFRSCPFCKNIKVCNKCNKCKECKKNLKYYLGLSDDQIVRYRKRIRVEHFISHYKNGRTSNIKDRNICMLQDTVYNRYTDFLLIKMSKEKVGIENTYVKWIGKRKVLFRKA